MVLSRTDLRFAANNVARYILATFSIGSFVGIIEYFVVLGLDLRQPLLFEESRFSFLNLLLAAGVYGGFFVAGCLVFLPAALALNTLFRKFFDVTLLPQPDVPRAAAGSAVGFALFVALATYLDWGEWNLMKLTNMLLPFQHMYSGFLPSAILKFLFAVALSPLLFRVRMSNRVLRIGMISILAAVVLPALLLSTRRREPASGARAADALPNLLIIVSDALRADHLPCYGNTRVVAPNIDRLAEEGSLFANEYVQAPVTGPSITSLLTGLYPIHHGVMGYLEPPAASNPTLAEMLGSNGYSTAAIVSNMMGDYRTLGKGFKHYDDLFFSPLGRDFHARLNGLTLSGFLRRSDWGMLGHYHPERRGDETADLAIEYLRGARRPFFLFLHIMEPHSPYGSGEPYDSMYDPQSYEPVMVTGPNSDIIDELSWKLPDKLKDDPGFDPKNKRISRELVRKIISLYDGDITFMDSQLGRILEALRANGALDETIVVLTADHGECLFEHNLSMEHNRYLYDSTLHVPLIFRYPPLIPAGEVFDEIVESIDILPTVLDMCGIEPPHTVDGRSLLPFFRHGQPEGFQYAYSLVGTNPKKLMFSVRSSQYKYIYRPHNDSRELYYVTDDKTESNNTADAMPDKAMEFHALLDEWIQRGPKLVEKEGRRLSPVEAEKLKALGYVD